MSPSVDPPSAAATDLTGPSGSTAAAVALARVLDPQAFEPSEHPRNVGFELQRADRKRTAVAHAVRALAADYRRVAGDPETVNLVAKAMRETDALAHNTPTCTLVPWEQLDARNKGWYRAKARAAIGALAGYRLVSEVPS